MLDYSTMNLDAIRKLRPYKLPPTYHVDAHMDSSRSGDPPGYPSYFIQHVYTSHGNPPPHGRGPSDVFVDPETGTLYWIPETANGKTNEEFWASRHRMLTRFWLQLPWEHERVQLWIQHTFQNHRNCYYDPNGDPSRGKFVIYPVPDYELKKSHIDDLWRDDVKEAVRAADEAVNADLIEKRTAMATPENHMAHVIIRRYYPDHPVETTIKYMAEPPKLSQADWWEREASLPTLEECEKRDARWLGYDFNHPRETGRHCTRCGRDT